MADRPVGAREAVERRRYGQHAPLDERRRGVGYVAAHQIRTAGAVDQGRGLRVLCRSAQRAAEYSLSCVSYGAEGVGAQTDAWRGPVRLVGAHVADQIDLSPSSFLVRVSSNQRKHSCRGFMAHPMELLGWLSSCIYHRTGPAVLGFTCHLQSCICIFLFDTEVYTFANVDTASQNDSNRILARYCLCCKVYADISPVVLPSQLSKVVSITRKYLPR